MGGAFAERAGWKEWNSTDARAKKSVPISHPCPVPSAIRQPMPDPWFLMRRLQHHPRRPPKTQPRGGGDEPLPANRHPDANPRHAPVPQAQTHAQTQDSRPTSAPNLDTPGDPATLPSPPKAQPAADPRSGSARVRGDPVFGAVAQLVRVPDCRSGGCGFESRPPRLRKPRCSRGLLLFEAGTVEVVLVAFGPHASDMRPELGAPASSRVIASSASRARSATGVSAARSYSCVVVILACPMYSLSTCMGMTRAIRVP